MSTRAPCAVLFEHKPLIEKFLALSGVFLRVNDPEFIVSVAYVAWHSWATTVELCQNRRLWKAMNDCFVRRLPANGLKAQARPVFGKLLRSLLERVKEHLFEGSSIADQDAFVLPSVKVLQRHYRDGYSLAAAMSRSGRNSVPHVAISTMVAAADGLADNDLSVQYDRLCGAMQNACGRDVDRRVIKRLMSRAGFSAEKQSRAVASKVLYSVQGLYNFCESYKQLTDLFGRLYGPAWDDNVLFLDETHTEVGFGPNNTKTYVRNSNVSKKRKSAEHVPMKKHVTMVLPYTGSGKILPPQLITAGKKTIPAGSGVSKESFVEVVSSRGIHSRTLTDVDIAMALQQQSPAVFASSEKGSQTKDTWLHYLTHTIIPSFEAIAGPADQLRPKLIVVDGHSSHLSIEAYRKCVDHGIVLLRYTPNTTSFCQPPDCGANRAFKAFLRNTLKGIGMNLYAEQVESQKSVESLAKKSQVKYDRKKSMTKRSLEQEVAATLACTYLLAARPQTLVNSVKNCHLHSSCDVRRLFDENNEDVTYKAMEVERGSPEVLSVQSLIHETSDSAAYNVAVREGVEARAFSLKPMPVDRKPMMGTSDAVRSMEVAAAVEKLDETFPDIAQASRQSKAKIMKDECRPLQERYMAAIQVAESRDKRAKRLYQQIKSMTAELAKARANAQEHVILETTPLFFSNRDKERPEPTHDREIRSAAVPVEIPAVQSTYPPPTATRKLPARRTKCHAAGCHNYGSVDMEHPDDDKFDTLLCEKHCHCTVCDDPWYGEVVLCTGGCHSLIHYDCTGVDKDDCELFEFDSDEWPQSWPRMLEEMQLTDDPVSTVFYVKGFQCDKCKVRTGVYPCIDS